MLCEVVDIHQCEVWGDNVYISVGDIPKRPNIRLVVLKPWQRHICGDGIVASFIAGLIDSDNISC